MEVPNIRPTFAPAASSLALVTSAVASIPVDNTRNLRGAPKNSVAKKGGHKLCVRQL